MVVARNLCGFATYLPDKVGQGLADSGRHCHACLGNSYTHRSGEKQDHLDSKVQLKGGDGGGIHWKVADLRKLQMI